MTLRVTHRPATEDEHRTMRRLLATAPGAGARFKEGFENAVVLFGACMLAAVLGWLALGWLAGALFDRGWNLADPATLWFAAIATALCAIHAIVSSLRWVRSLPDDRASLREDIATGSVDEEHYRFSAAKRFQEQESGALVYFLRIDDDTCLSVLDAESRELGLAGGDPLQSSFQPRAELTLCRAHRSGDVLSRISDGEVLPVEGPVALTDDTSAWPEMDRVHAVRWDELEARFGSELDEDCNR